jgi:hypothetical protein
LFSVSESNFRTPTFITPWIMIFTIVSDHRFLKQ